MNSVIKQGVTIITPTIRKSYLQNLLKNFNRQLWDLKELIIIVNNNNIALKKYKRLTRKYDNVRVFRMDQRSNLGACLNFGVSMASYDYIAKFDDDDYYSPYYIQEAMDLFAAKDADIVGKRSTYFFFPHRSKLLFRDVPFKAGDKVSVVAGPTIMFHKRVFGRVHFSTKLYQGSDVRFIKSCIRKGYRAYTTSPNNFSSIRRANRLSHTWKISDRQLLSHKRAKIITTTNFKKYIVQKPAPS